ncbi:MAG TPA: hypothetical protein PKG48_13775 [Bacteroidales bacterium]|nr:hypothetical protein [Bacteroidales bacterium]HPS62125.1 hypothetical protein [Bacteroidales bacterium]
MKRIIIGAIVGTIILFAFQALMWMGGCNREFYRYAPMQDSLLSRMSKTLPGEGLYSMPMADPTAADYNAKQAEIRNKLVGKPWAMVFYHTKMDYSGMGFLYGILGSLIASLFVATVLYAGKFGNFAARFAVVFAFGLFALIMGPLSDMNWWSFPWSFIRPKVLDLVIGWGLVSVWMGWFVKPKV